MAEAIQNPQSQIVNVKVHYQPDAPLVPVRLDLSKPADFLGKIKNELVDAADNFEWNMEHMFIAGGSAVSLDDAEGFESMVRTDRSSIILRLCETKLRLVVEHAESQQQCEFVVPAQTAMWNNTVVIELKRFVRKQFNASAEADVHLCVKEDQEREIVNIDDLESFVKTMQEESALDVLELVAKCELIQKHKVLPLIIPNNYNYDASTGKLLEDTTQKRTSLKVYEPALEFIRGIKSKVAVVSIVGKARTGKSLIAGDLYVEGAVPCPFDLGHLMTACTFGIWVGVETQPHPDKEDTVVLVLDVEGSGAYDAQSQHDMQLMVVALMMSSYFIYNTKGAFDSKALEELEFILELTERLQVSPGDDDNDDLYKCFPKFMWLLRDVHLLPVMPGTGETVSARTFFQEVVLKKARGRKREARHQNEIRELFQELFQDFNAFTLPSPASSETLAKIGILPRSHLFPKFTSRLAEFRQLVMSEIDVKTIYSPHSPTGEEGGQLIPCNGPRLARWIEVFVEQVSDPNNVPQISSMVDSVMTNLFNDAKKAALDDYQHRMDVELLKLKGGVKTRALDESEILEVHRLVYQLVLDAHTDLKPPTVSGIDIDVEDEDDIKEGGSMASLQMKIFREFRDEIGADKTTTNTGTDDKTATGPGASDETATSTGADFGRLAILPAILAKNSMLSLEECERWVDGHTAEMLKYGEAVSEYTVKDVEDGVEKLEKMYFSQCKGPAKQKVWSRFYEQRVNYAIAWFKQSKKQYEEFKRFEAQQEEYRLKSEADIREMKEQAEKEKRAHNLKIQELQTQMQNADKELKQKLQEQQDDMEAQEKKRKEEQDRKMKDMQDALEKQKAASKKQLADLREQMNNRKSSGGSYSVDSYVLTYPSCEPKSINEVAVYDRLLSYDEITGELVFSDVLLLSHYGAHDGIDRYVDMVCLQFDDDGSSITLTKTHMIYAVQNGSITLIPAGQVEVGDELLYSAHCSKQMRVKVIKKESVVSRPRSVFTKHGNLIVNGIATSSFTGSGLLAHRLQRTAVLLGYALLSTFSPKTITDYKAVSALRDGIYYGALKPLMLCSRILCLLPILILILSVAL